MTVGELIALLKEHPEERRVVVQAYEIGYVDLLPKRVVTLPLAVEVHADEDEYCYGPHDDAFYHQGQLPEGREVVEPVAFHRG